MAKQIKRYGKDASNYRHGGHTEYKSEYNSWRAMNERCYNQRYAHYAHYGGRGIIVCERWRKPAQIGFVNFLADMGKKPGAGYSLDRVDNNGNYEPTNCKWSTQREQFRNSSNVTYYMIDGINDTFRGHLDRVADRSESFVRKSMQRGLAFEEALKIPNDGQQRLAEARLEAALAKRSNCLICKIKCGKGAKKYCSRACANIGRFHSA